MTKRNPKTFDVVIVEIAHSTVVAVIGRDLTEERAEKRIETGVGRTNLDAYYVTKVKSGAKVGDHVSE